MKKIITALGFIGSLLFIGCELDPTVYTGTAVGLEANNTITQISVPVAGSSRSFPATVTTLSGDARTFGLEFVGDAPVAGGVTLGSITIPANSYEGTATVNFDFNAINLGDGETDFFAIQAASESTDIIANVVEIEYFKAIVCNDATFTLNTDLYAEETGFTITNDATGAVVYTMPALSRGVQTFTAPITLPDGCYTATITDAFGDGQVDGSNPNGNYSITCSILTFASGGGVFGASQTRSFCVNQ
jgi:hypothetical protein